MSQSSPAAGPIKKPLLSDTVYTWLKHSAMYVLPAIGACYVVLAQLWHLPHAEEVTGSIAALNTLLGVFVGASTASYNKSDAKYVGDLVVEDHPADSSVKMFVAHLNQDPNVVSAMPEATFKVQPQK